MPYSAKRASNKSDQSSLPHVDFTFRKAQGILVARTSVLDVPSIPQTVKLMVEEGRRFSCRLFLLDHRWAKVQTYQFAELYQSLPRRAADFHLPHRARLAVILPSADKSEKVFFEAFIANRGRQFKIFEDESPAVAWLMKANVLDFM